MAYCVMRPLPLRRRCRRGSKPAPRRLGKRRATILRVACALLMCVIGVWPTAAVAAPVVHSAGTSLGGLPITVQRHGSGHDTLLVLATIHGNEFAGTPLVEKFAAWLEAHPAELTGKTVVLMPVANPDGYRTQVRTNRQSVDLNRNFPAGNWQQAGPGKRGSPRLHGPTPLSEPESRALMRVVCTFFPDRVVSIHQPLECVDYDGPAAQLAAEMSAACGLPVKKLGSRPGSLGSFVGVTLERPIVTLELPRDACGAQSRGVDAAADALWDQYGGALIAALRYQAPPTLDGQPDLDQHATTPRSEASP